MRQRRLLAIVNPERLRRILRRLFAEEEFMSPYGLRALSKFHDANPFVLNVGGTTFRVDYEPAESTSGLFGGNSNWRGPIWFPLNYLLIESLQKFHYYLGDDYKVEFPTGSGTMLTLWEISQQLARRLIGLFREGTRRHAAVPAPGVGTRERRALARPPALPRILQRRHRARTRGIASDRLDCARSQVDPASRRIRRPGPSGSGPRLQRESYALSGYVTGRKHGCERDAPTGPRRPRLLSLGRGQPLPALRRHGRAPSYLRRSQRDGICRVGAQRPARERRRRFQRLGRRRNRMRLRRESGRVGAVRSRRRRGARYKYELEDQRRPPAAAASVDPYRFYAEQRPRNASIVWDAPPFGWADAAGWRTRRAAAPRRAHLDLRGAPRFVGAHPRRGQPVSDLSRARRAARALRARPGLHAHRTAPDHGAPLRRIVGLSDHGLVRADEPLRHARRLARVHRRRARRGARRHRRLGAGTLSRPTTSASAGSTARACTNTPIRAKASTTSGGRSTFNLGRTEVANILLASALFWLREFHIDGLRVDAVSSIIYLDYDRKDGEWIPNVFGGNENLESTAFLRRFNTVVYGEFPDVITIAEESTAYAGVTTPRVARRPRLRLQVEHGLDARHARVHAARSALPRLPPRRISFGLIYAFTENFVLPLSHDEVVHGKGSLLGKMPGGDRREVREPAAAVRPHVRLTPARS